MAQYLPILAMVVLVLLFVSLSFAASGLLGPRRRPTSAKEAPYECGIVPETEPTERFPVRFYLVAMGVFLLVLLVPFGYLLSTGAVDWGPARRVAEHLAPRRVVRVAGTPGREGLDPGPPPEVEAA